MDYNILFVLLLVSNTMYLRRKGATGAAARRTLLKGELHMIATVHQQMYIRNIKNLSEF